VPSKTQVDRLGDRLRDGNVTDADLTLLDTYRRSFGAVYESVIATIREAGDFEPTGRPAKSTSSIVDKLRRESIRLTQMQDIAGCRLIVPRVKSQNRLVRLLAKNLGGDVVDRRKTPSHGYRAIHIIVNIDSKPIEIQVRTTLQHLWAELSEKLSDIVDPSIKYGGGPKEWRDALDGISDTVSRVEALEVQGVSPEKRRELRSVKQKLRRVLKNITENLKEEA
jgi:ppGpp synthetase/RelA/SpoT-type nucleotidyltranferase